jgi:predicted ferric reductase
MEVSKQIIEVLDAVCQKFGLAIDWSQQNILPYVQQLGEKVVNYELWTSVMWLVIGVIGMIITGLAIRHSLKGYKEACYSEEGFYLFVGLLATLGLLISCLIVGQQVMDIIACKTFPEKVVVDYVQAMMNNK